MSSIEPSTDSAADPPIAVLDACVLVGIVRRELLFAAAKSGYFRPRWTDRIEAEWRATLERDPRLGDAAALDGELALARLAFAGVRVEDWEAHEGPLALPDWNDRHVLAAAIAAEATLIVTDNLRDFPRRALAAHGVEARAADDFLRGWAEARPEDALAASAATAGSPAPDDIRARLKRARLPRFAKEVARRASDGAATPS